MDADFESGDAMHIYPSSNGPTGKLSESIGFDATTKTTGTKGPKPTDSASISNSSYEPTTDLSQLLSSVRALPEVREDIVQNVAARLASGELLTPQITQETAQAAYDDLIG